MSTLSLMRSKILKSRIEKVVNRIEQDNSFINMKRCYLELKYIMELYSNNIEYKDYEEMLTHLINMTQYKLYQLREGL